MNPTSLLGWSGLVSVICPTNTFSPIQGKGEHFLKGLDPASRAAREFVIATLSFPSWCTSFLFWVDAFWDRCSVVFPFQLGSHQKGPKAVPRCIPFLTPMLNPFSIDFPPNFDPRNHKNIGFSTGKTKVFLKIAFHIGHWFFTYFYPNLLPFSLPKSIKIH